MQAPVFKTLNTPEIQKHVGVNPARIYAYGKAVQNVQAPYITWQLISSQPYSRLSRVPNADRVTAQIDCYAISEAVASSLALSVRNALDNAKVHNELSLQTNDADANLYRVCFTATFITSR